MHIHVHTILTIITLKIWWSEFNINACMCLVSSACIIILFANVSQEYVEIEQRLETEERLLHFIVNGEIKKRGGQRGDSIEKTVPPRHQEL